MPSLLDKRLDTRQLHDRSMTEHGTDDPALDISDLSQAQAHLANQDEAAPAGNLFDNDSRPPPYNAHRHDLDLDQAVSAIPLMLDQTGHW